jgi:regulator of replication initiation timing
MTPLSDRELGEAMSRLERSLHDIRNLRQQIIMIEDEVEQLRIAHTQLKTRIATIISVGSCLVAVTAWLIEYSFH